jgi:hypothetical protein
MRTDAVKALKELRQCCVYNNEVKSKICDKKENPQQIVPIFCYRRHMLLQLPGILPQKLPQAHNQSDLSRCSCRNQSELCLDIAAEQFSVIADTGRKQIRAGTLWQNCFHQWLPQTHTDDKSLHYCAAIGCHWHATS